MFQLFEWRTAICKQTILIQIMSLETWPMTCIFNIFQKVGMISPCPPSYYSKKCHLETYWPNLKFRQKTEILQNLGRIPTFFLADCGKCPRILPSLTRPSPAGITQKQQKEALSAPCPRRPLLTSCSNQIYLIHYGVLNNTGEIAYLSMLY